MKKTIVYLLISIFLLSFVNAQTSDNITTPDNPSYYMKVKVPEYFQLLFSRDKVAKRLEFIEKRRLEYEKLALNFNETTKNKQYKLLEQLRKLESRRLEEQRNIESQFSLLTNDRKLFVLSQLHKHQDRLMEVKEKLPEPTQQRIVVAIESSGKVIQKFNSSVENIKQFEKLRIRNENRKQ